MVWGDQDAGGEVLLRLLRQILAGHPQRSQAPPSGPLPPTRPFPLVPILLLYPPCASPRHLSPLRPHRKMMMPFITSSFFPSLSRSSSAFFHWFHFSVSSLIILFDFSTFSLPKGFCQYGDACKYFHPPPAQPVPGLSSLPLSACSTQLSFFPLNIMQLLSIIDLYMFPQTHCQTTSIF